MRRLCILLRILAVVMLLAGAAERARTDDAPAPEALQAANQLFAILSPDLMKQLTTQMDNLIWPVLEQKARAENIDNATIGELREEFEHIQLQNLADVMKDAPPIYARHFTVDELHQLIAFYQSPIGLKAMKELPQVMAEFVGAIAPRLQSVQKQSIDRFNDILRQHGYLK